jgi:hypothetical protein
MLTDHHTPPPTASATTNGRPAADWAMWFRHIINLLGDSSAHLYDRAQAVEQLRIVARVAAETGELEIEQRGSGFSIRRHGGTDT